MISYGKIIVIGAMSKFNRSASLNIAVREFLMQDKTETGYLL